MRRALIVAAVAALTLAACKSDGRDMRPPKFPPPATTTTTTYPPLGTG